MPRKTWIRSAADLAALDASMRPRPDAAENPVLDVRALAQARASMRPRPDAAENLPRDRDRERRHHGASMRPRPDAAENSTPGFPRRGSGRSFNEAAARCRGKHGGAAVDLRADLELQ